MNNISLLFSEIQINMPSYQHNKNDASNNLNYHILTNITLSKIIGRLVKVTLFCENAPSMWDRHKLKETLKPGVFIPKA